MLVGIDGDSTRLIGFPLTDLLSLGSKKKNSRSYWGELTLSRCKNSQCQSKEGGGKAARCQKLLLSPVPTKNRI